MTRIGSSNGAFRYMKEVNLLLIILILAVFLVFLPFIFASEYYVADWFSTDDAFYYFKIAENISAGNGSTFDGISVVNGYHPLWLIILIPIFTLIKIDIFLPLRIVILTQLLFSIGTIVLFYRYLCLRISIYSSFLISLIWILFYPIFSITTNGTEAAINAFAITWFWIVFSRNTDSLEQIRDIKSIIQIGFVAVIVLLSRLDNIFFLVIFGIWLGIKYILMSEWKFSPSIRKRFILTEIAYVAPMTITLGVYLTWNRFIVGTMMPISGQIKKYWGTLPKTTYGTSVSGIGEFLGEFFSPSTDLGPWSLILKPFFSSLNSFEAYYFYGTKSIFIGTVIVVGLIFLIGILVGKQDKFILNKITEFSIIPLLLGSLVHISYYKINGYLAPRSWYWIYESFFIVLILAIIFELVNRLLSQKESIYIHVLVISLLIFGSYQVLAPHISQIIKMIKYPTEQEHSYLSISRWLEENSDSNSIIGMTGAGSTAYFINDRIIMNLDGLVNGVDYFNHLKNNSALEYLENNNVSYIFGREWILIETDPYQANYRRNLNQSAIVDIFDESLTLWKINYQQ